MRRFLLGSTLFTCFASAHAATWSFDYVGATSQNAPFALPHIPGRFVAEDVNGDGWITRSEVQYFELLGYRMAPGADMRLPGLPPGSVTSSLSTFSFALDSHALKFTGVGGTWHNSFEMMTSELRYATPMGAFTFDLSPAVLEIQQMDGIPPVAGPVSPSPIPEPLTSSMLAAGLAGIWVTSRVARR
jgi:hypothetical protein